MRLSHTLARMSVAFDVANLVSATGLIPLLGWASWGQADLADERLSVATDMGANAGLKVASPVGGWSPARTASMTWRCFGLGAGGRTRTVSTARRTPQEAALTFLAGFGGKPGRQSSQPPDTSTHCRTSLGYQTRKRPLPMDGKGL